MALKVRDDDEGPVPALGPGLRLVWNSLAGVVVPTTEASEEFAEPLGGPDGLFAGLDGREVTVRGRRWRIEVFSTWEQTDRRWVQLALRGQSGQPDYMLTLRLAASDGVRHAVLTLASWLANPAKNREILNVA